MDHCSCIYVIENTVNGKKYVGQTTDYADRVNSHLNALRNGRSHCRHLQYAYNKYGEDAFSFSIIERCQVDMLNEREMFWIDKLNTFKDGYNMDLGGGGIRGYHFTDEQRQKISSALKGKVVSDEAKARMRANHADFSGENNPCHGVPWSKRLSPEKQDQVRAEYSRRFSGVGNPNYGKKMSEEQKRKLSESHKAHFRMYGNPLKGRKRPELSGTNSYRARRVVCVNTGVVYATIDEAAAAAGVPQGDISSCCAGRLHSAGKDKLGNRLIWKYFEDYTPMTSSEINEYFLSIDRQRIEKQQKKVMCISTGEVFMSMKEACEKYHIDPSSLSGHCRGKKSLNGCGRHPETNELLKWKYIE